MAWPPGAALALGRRAGPRAGRSPLLSPGAPSWDRSRAHCRLGWSAWRGWSARGGRRVAPTIPVLSSAWHTGLAGMISLRTLRCTDHPRVSGWALNRATSVPAEGGRGTQGRRGSRRDNGSQWLGDAGRGPGRGVRAPPGAREGQPCPHLHLAPRKGSRTSDLQPVENARVLCTPLGAWPCSCSR